MYNITMPRREKFFPGQFYHIYNKGVNDRIFLDEEDYSRFKHNVLEFSIGKSAVVNPEYTAKPKLDAIISKTPIAPNNLVNIVASYLMPDHFHLLLRPVTEKGSVMFMRKLSIGYANYFNQKYKRSGPLFRGRYKSNLIVKKEFKPKNLCDCALFNTDFGNPSPISG